MRNLLLLLLAGALTVQAVAADAPPAASEAQFLSNTRQLTFEGKRSGEGYFSPDGKQLIFQSEREAGNPFYQIYILDLSTGDTTRVSPGTGKTTCAFFQAGTGRVMFASTHVDPESAAKQKAEIDFRASGQTRRYSWDYDPAFEIFSCNRNGSQITRLTDSPGYDAEGSFSPDGKQIVFCSTRAAYPVENLGEREVNRFAKDPSYFGDIYLMNADGSNVRRLTEAPGYDGGPFFSPDGARIVWRHFDESGMIADVWTMKIDGSDKHRVTDFKSMSWAPFYHPSGKYLIFTSNKLGFENFELFVVDAAGEHEPVRVTFTDGFDGLPTFSPDGHKLCWTTNRTADKTSQLFLADWNDEAALKAIESAPKRAVTAPQSTGVATEEHPATEHPATPAPAAASNDLTPEITAQDLQREVEWLADPKREGRMTGSDGAQAAAKWLETYFKSAGLQPVGGSYLEDFQFNAGEFLVPEKNHLDLTVADDAGKAGAAQKFTVQHDFCPLSFSESGDAEGEVVFAGYGLSVPESNTEPRYNSYDGLDVKDKIVLLLRYVPEGVDAPRRAQLNRYAGLRYKAMLARERGAKAVLIVAGPNSPEAGKLLDLTSDHSIANFSGIISVSITGEVADNLLKSSGKSLKDLQSAIDVENPHASGGLLLPKVRVKVQAGVQHLKYTDHNVLAAIPPGGDASSNGGAAAEWIVVGAHYDHLGRGIASSSLARSGEENKIHPGADDNASGDAVIMELAASLAKERNEHPEEFRRGIVFAEWSGEEIGLIGSAAFCEHPPMDLSRVAAYVNFDMVGRLRENKLTLQGVGSSQLWPREIEKRNVAAGFSLVMQQDPYLPTDTTSFYPKRIPVLNFFTGAHEDYHRPTDTPEKLNYEGMERIAKFARQIVLDLAGAPERPDYAHVKPSEQEKGSRETLRAYLGTIPDYSTEVKGVKLTGVRGDSPAEKAGLKGGDVIVEFAGQKITNIYDYTYALDAVKIGQPVPVIVERDAQQVTLSVTPEARK